MTIIMNIDQFAYDAVPYPSFTFSQTHPDHLATMASFNGVNPAEPKKCRVLELGCGDGTNLLWCASTLGESEFVGIDLSQNHIDGANSGAVELGLTNVSFFREDIMEFDRDKFGEFDYIVAHGLFSWVPVQVREKLLQIYSDCLAPNGVGYISFNAYPGCHVQRMIRDMMLFHTNGFSAPTEKVLQARALIKFIGDTAEVDSIYQKILKSEVDLLDDRSGSSVFHDDLSEVNDAFYFLEFVEMIKPHGLQFLCEAKSSSQHKINWTPSSVDAFNSLGDDILRREQYLDFIIGRRFRSTLVCRESVMVNRDCTPEISRYFIASKLKPLSENLDIASLDSERFGVEDGTSIETNHPFTKAALVHLNRIGGEEIRFEDLVRECIALGGNRDASNLEEDKVRTAGFLVELYKVGFVHLRRRPARYASCAGEMPEGSRFARWQVGRKSNAVRTLTGSNLKLEGNYVLALLAMLDGTRDRTTLAKELTRLFESDGAKREDFEKDLPESINRVLSELASFGLLAK